jgi:putative acetyltransferase
MNVQVRPERPGDANAVRDINQLAFGGPLEARIVEALRGTPGSISLVATVNGRVIGHILFTPVAIDPPPPSLRAAGLAPMAVRPEFQRMGVGAALIHTGLDECRRLGYAAVVVVGHPEYYPRFGFVAAHTRGLRYVDDVPAEAFMVLELEPGTLPARGGVVRYRPEFTAEE